MSKTKWTEEIIQFLKDNVYGKSNIELAKMINERFGTSFTKYSVSTYKTKNGILNYGPKQNVTRVWTDEVKDFIIKNYQGKDNIELADMINKKFGLNINNKDVGQFKAKMKSKTGIDLSSGINKGFYKKGNVPACKGKKWDEFKSKESQERSKSSWFKKGCITFNAHKIGTEMTKYNDNRKHNYIYVKVANGKRKQNWKLKHHLIWEQYNGPIPEGHNVIFADGNNRNFNIDNLMLVSYAEELDLNMLHLRFNDKELTKTGLNIVKVHKKIVERKKNGR